MVEQLDLFGVFENTPPSDKLLSKVKALYEPVNDAWNMAIDERQAAPAQQKGDLRRLTVQLEQILMTIENITSTGG